MKKLFVVTLLFMLAGSAFGADHPMQFLRSVITQRTTLSAIESTAMKLL